MLTGGLHRCHFRRRFLEHCQSFSLLALFRTGVLPDLSAVFTLSGSHLVIFLPCAATVDDEERFPDSRFACMELADGPCMGNDEGHRPEDRLDGTTGLLEDLQASRELLRNLLGIMELFERLGDKRKEDKGGEEEE